jgi:hypothetical protein
MGKKTEALVSAIKEFTLACAQPAAEITAVQIENKKLQAENAVQIKIMDDVNEEYMPGGHRTPGSEERVEQDKRNIAAVKILEKNTKILMSNLAFMNKRKAELDAVTPKFKAKLSELDKLIAGKVKDKSNAGKYAKVLAFIESSKELLTAVTKI